MFSAFIRILPPAGIACCALIIRLLMPWPNCDASTLQGHKCSGRSNSQVTLEPLSVNKALSLMSLGRAVIFFMGAPPLEKVRSCCVRFLVLLKAGKAFKRFSFAVSGLFRDKLRVA